MTSTSGNDGTSIITVTFDVSRNLDLAAVDVQNRISQAEGRLPAEVRQIGITVTKASTATPARGRSSSASPPTAPPSA